MATQTKERPWDLVGETITITKETLNVGWGFMTKPEGGYQYPPMGAELPNDYPMEPLFSGTARVILNVAEWAEATVEAGADVASSLYVKGEEIGWVPVSLDYYGMEELRKVAAGRKKQMVLECYRFKYEDTGEWVH